MFGLGKEQISILRNRQKIEQVLLSPETTALEKEKLSLVQKARIFAIEELKLNEKGGFVYYSKLDRDQIGWNVSASLPLKFESHTWWFPIAGTVPYKGFFDKKSAEECEEELKEKGLDTRIRITGGYSTLGWFSDPIFSPQLNYDNAHLVGLVFHEMAHATVYLPGDSTLNESYASFVEEKGIQQFYHSKSDEETLEKLKLEKQNKAKTLLLLKKYAVGLNEIYNSSLSTEEKSTAKKRTIDEFKLEAIRLGFVTEELKSKFLNKDWNNEDFLGAFRYNSFESDFEELWLRSNKDFSVFHSLVKDTFSLSPEERDKILKIKKTSPQEK